MLIACVILTIMLLIKTNEVGDLQTALTHCNSQAEQHRDTSERLSKQVKDLGQQLDNNSKAIPKIVRNVDVVICDSRVKQQAIDNLLSTRGVQSGGNDVKQLKAATKSNVADIDDELPPELVRLLQ
jgi:ABC-type transporter Mla subunit MlaD